MLFAWEEEGSRKSGQRQGKMRNSMRKALKDRDIDEHIWLQRTQERTQWRKIVNNKHRDRASSSSTAAAASSGTGRGRGRGRSTATPPFPGALQCPHPGCKYWARGGRGIAKHTAMMHTEGTQAQDGYACEHCPYKISTRSALAKHVNACHGPNANATVMVCNVCGEYSPSRTALVKHKYRVHGSEIAGGRQ